MHCMGQSKWSVARRRQTRVQQVQSPTCSSLGHQKAGSPGPVLCVLVFRKSVRLAELRQASAKSPAKGELSSAYALLTVEKTNQKTGPGNQNSGVPNGGGGNLGHSVMFYTNMF